MRAKIWAVATLAFIGLAPLAEAQEDWRDERRQAWHWLREACENGDQRACWRLREMRQEWRARREWREQQEQDGDSGAYPIPEERD